MLGSVRLSRAISSRPRSKELTRTVATTSARLQHRLGAECRIFMDNKILQIKAGLRQQAQSHRSHVDRSSQRQTDGAAQSGCAGVARRAGPGNSASTSDDAGDHSAATGAQKFQRTTFNVRRQRVSSKK